MVEFKQIRFYCLFTNSFTAQTSPKHVCAEPSACHSIAYITSQKCSTLSASHLIIGASSLAPSLALIDPSQSYILPSYCPQIASQGQTSGMPQLARCFAALLSNCSFIFPPFLHLCVHLCLLCTIPVPLRTHSVSPCTFT